MTLSVYRWEDVHRYFPQEVIEQYRKKIIEEWKSGKFKDREIWERYGMSENAFYDFIKRYSEEENLKDKPSKPKNPSHKLDQDDMQIRSDCGKEFYNEAVRNFCNKNNIRLHFIPKGSPWLQAFIERGFRTIKEEFLNLVWIGNWNKFNDVLRDARYGSNHRPNSAFDYKNPLEVMAIKIPNLPQQVCGH